MSFSLSLLFPLWPLQISIARTSSSPPSPFAQCSSRGFVSGGHSMQFMCLCYRPFNAGLIASWSGLQHTTAKERSLFDDRNYHKIACPSVINPPQIYSTVPLFHCWIDHHRPSSSCPRFRITDLGRGNYTMERSDDVGSHMFYFNSLKKSSPSSLPPVQQGFIDTSCVCLHPSLSGRESPLVAPWWFLQIVSVTKLIISRLLNA